jgi:hypothetical protein
MGDGLWLFGLSGWTSSWRSRPLLQDYRGNASEILGDTAHNNISRRLAKTLHSQLLD